METENKRQIAEQAFPPVYPHNTVYAREHGELEQWRASLKANIVCRDALEKVISDGWDGMHITGEAVKTALAAFGAERVSCVLAATIHSRPGDERFSRSNREWAETVPDTTSDSSFRYAVRNHSTIVDSFISLARKDMQPEMRREEKKLSIRAQLAAAKAVQPEKSAAKQHKQEKEAR